jgi:hypothetical protein
VVEGAFTQESGLPRYVGGSPLIGHQL